MSGRPTAALAVAVGLAACSSPPEGPAEALAVRVEGQLAANAASIATALEGAGVTVSPEAVGDADLTCPAVRDPAPGDTATCQGEIAGASVEVELEFGDGGAVTVTGVFPGP